MLGIRQQFKRSLAVEARHADLAQVRTFVEHATRKAGLSAKDAREMRLAVDEACANIMEHAYGGGSGPLEVMAERQRDRLVVTLVDQGKPIDEPERVRNVGAPDLSRYVQVGKKGGLGLYLIHKLTDEVDYERRGDENFLALVKRAPVGAVVLSVPSLRLRSLRLRFIVQSGLVLVLLTCAAYLFMHNRQHFAVKRTVLAGAVALASELGAQAADLLLKPAHFGPKQTRLIAAASRATQRPGIDDVVIIDHEGTIWAARDEELVFQSFEAPIGVLRVPPGGERVPDLVADRAMEVDGAYWVEVPASLPAAGRGLEGAVAVSLGTVYVAVSAPHVEELIASERLTLLYVFCAVLGVGLLAVTLLVSVVVKPIQRLTDGVRAIGSGKQVRLEERGLSEIDGIARAFNEVTGKFLDARQSLVEKERLEQEMQVAQNIQQSLLPREIPEMVGYQVGTFYRAAKEVGGDYYDIVKVGEDAWGVAVADVSGKGVPGSLVMMMIRTALRLEARDENSASGVLDRVNRFVTADMRRGMFVTMFYILLDAQERDIAFASAGHNPMILYRGETKQTFFLNPKGYPVGIDLPDPEVFGRVIRAERVSLNKDDLLVVYTDGITEAMNAQMEQYGMDRFLEAIKRYADQTPKEFCERLEVELAEWTGEAPQSDDMTLVAIKERMESGAAKVEARTRLLDLVQRERLSVAEACRQEGVSTSTYYRLKKRQQAEGDAGLRDRRRRAELGRLSHEEEMVLVGLIRQEPTWGAGRLAGPLSEKLGRDVKKHRVSASLRRLGLNRKDSRLALASAQGEFGTGAGYSISKLIGPQAGAVPLARMAQIKAEDPEPVADNDGETTGATTALAPLWVFPARLERVVPLTVVQGGAVDESTDDTGTPQSDDWGPEEATGT